MSRCLPCDGLCLKSKRCQDRNRNMRKILIVWKRPLHAKYCYQCRSKKEPNEVYVYKSFYFEFLYESIAFILFLYFEHNKIKWRSNKSHTCKVSSLVDITLEIYTLQSNCNSLGRYTIPGYVNTENMSVSVQRWNEIKRQGINL